MRGPRNPDDSAILFSFTWDRPASEHFSSGWDKVLTMRRMSSLSFHGAGALLWCLGVAAPAVVHAAPPPPATPAPAAAPKAKAKGKPGPTQGAPLPPLNVREQGPLILDNV